MGQPTLDIYNTNITWFSHLVSLLISLPTILISEEILLLTHPSATYSMEFLCKRLLRSTFSYHHWVKNLCAQCQWIRGLFSFRKYLFLYLLGMGIYQVLSHISESEKKKKKEKKRWREKKKERDLIVSEVYGASLNMLYCTCFN